jgi:AmiR/NasT family two-component response regulator
MDAKQDLVARKWQVPTPAPAQTPASPKAGLRVLLAERVAAPSSELADELERFGHEVLARVTTGQGALDYAGLLHPDAVLMEPELEDGPAIMTALKLTRALPGTAAVVLASHPGAANSSTRPNWGQVTLIHIEATPAELDAELRRAVAAAHDSADSETSSQAGESVQSVLAVIPALATEERNEQDEMLCEPSALSFTDEDLIAVDHFVDTPEVMRSPVTHGAPVFQSFGEASDEGNGGGEEDESDIVGRAAECLLERTGLSRSEVMRMMEQEAADTTQRLVDVARAVLDQDAPAIVSG